MEMYVESTAPTGPDGRLAGLTTIVTGGGSGLGRATCLRFAHESANVLVADIDATAADETCSLIADQGGTATAVRVDVTDDDSVAAMRDRALETFGRIDVMYANAGIPGFGPAHELDQTAWDRVMAVNLTGVWLCVRAVLPAMMSTRSGSIIATASAAGSIGVPGVFAYSVAKGGVIAMMRQIAAEYGPYGIRANSISPGTVYTPLVQKTHSDRSGAEASTRERVSAAVSSQYALRRIGEPEDIANAALYLASAESKWTTGANFAIDGGLTAI